MKKDKEASTGEAEWYKPQRTLNIGDGAAGPISARDEVAERTRQAPSGRAKQSDDPIGTGEADSAGSHTGRNPRTPFASAGIRPSGSAG